MANQKKRKDPLNDKKSAENRAAQAQEKRDPARPFNQMMPYLLVILAIFLLICILFVNREETGLFGAYLCDGLYIALGRGCILLPILMLNLALFYRRDRANGQLIWKIGVSIAFLILVCALIELRYLEKGFFDLALDRRGAGALGWAVGTAFHRLLGKFGTIWIVGMLLVVLFPFLVGTTPRAAVVGTIAAFRRLKEKKAKKEEDPSAPASNPSSNAPYARPQKPQTPPPTYAQSYTQQVPTPPPFDAMAGTNMSVGADDFFEQVPMTEQAQPYQAPSAPSVQGQTKDYYDRGRFAPTSSARIAPTPETPARSAKQKRVVAPTATPYIQGAQEIHGRPGYEKAASTVPKMEKPSKRGENNWLEIKSRDRFAPSKDSLLPENIQRSDTISHVRTVQLPAYREETKLETERTPVTSVKEELTEEIDTLQVEELTNEVISQTPQTDSVVENVTPAPIFETEEEDDKAPFDFDPTPKTEILTAQHGVTDAVSANDSVSKTIEQFISSQKVEKTQDYTPHYFDRPTPATPAPQQEQSEYIAPPLPYEYPPTDLLTYYDPPSDDVERELRENAELLVSKLQEFRIGIQVTGITRGPTITRYEVLPDPGIRVRQVLNVMDDVALLMSASGIRTEAPIPGKSAIGIEIPNRTVSTVGLRRLMEDDQFTQNKAPLYCALGEDVTGEPVYFDLAKMPHLLVAGATNSGKSVCINTLIASLIYRCSPEDVKLILIDPKKVEFSVYNGLPHMLIPPVTDPKKAAGALRWAVTEMDRRYQLLENTKGKNGSNARNITAYNEMRKENPQLPHMPFMVIVIDELADLMQTAPDDVESSLARLTQLARAAGIYLIIGTQRPSVDVITGKIKSNVPSRIAFTVASQIDSRTILDAAGAEKLIGRGDMIFAPTGSRARRVQGAFVSDAEVANIVDYVKSHNSRVEYDSNVAESINRAADELDKKNRRDAAPAEGGNDAGGISEEDLVLLKKVAGYFVSCGKASISDAQVRFEFGFQKGKRIVLLLERLGIIGPANGPKPREVKITQQEYEEMMMNDEVWTCISD